MAKNPMQRKAQNSFLLGILVTLLITGIIIAILIVQLTKITNEQKAAEAQLKKAYVLVEDIDSGSSVTADKLVLKDLDSNTIPSNTLTAADLTQKTDITDEAGNLIKKVNVIAKINLKKGTVITTDMIAEEGELQADIRKVEYNMIVLPSQIEANKYIDIRLRLPSGKDFIVVSHKQLQMPTIDGIDSLNTIWLNMNETEILTLSCAIVESYKIEGSLLYVSEYIEPGLQGAATPTYIPDDATLTLISQDPNCVAEAKNALFERNNNASQKNAVRNPINSSLNENAEKGNDNVIDKVEDELKTTQEQRQQYLETLGGSY